MRKEAAFLPELERVLSGRKEDARACATNSCGSSNQNRR